MTTSPCDCWSWWRSAVLSALSPRPERVFYAFDDRVKDVALFGWVDHCEAVIVRPPQLNITFS